MVDCESGGRTRAVLDALRSAFYVAEARQRPVVVPEFGKALRLLRDAKSRGWVCRRLRERHSLKLTPSTLLQYERGTVAAPDPAILWALAAVYGVAFDELLSVLLSDRAGRPIRLSDEDAGMMSVSADERRLLNALRDLPLTRQAMQTEMWIDMARREQSAKKANRARQGSTASSA